MEFLFKHPESGEVRSVTLSDEDIQSRLSDQLLDELTCDWEPIGETNVIECGCESYIYEFELQDRK